MKLETAIEIIRRYKFYIKYQDIAEALSLSLAGVKKRLIRKSDLKYDEAFVLAKKFDLPVRLFFSVEELPNTLPIEYYENNKIHLERNPNMMKYYMDFEIAYKYRKSCGKDDFKIICCIGDKLAGGTLWCNNGDILLLDTTRTDINEAGLYAYECEDGNYVAMAYIENKPDGVHFKYTNPVSEEIRTNEFLCEVKFRPIGRIIKNLMFFA